MRDGEVREVRFRRDGMGNMVGEVDGEGVQLGRDFHTTVLVEPGETWRVRIHVRNGFRAAQALNRTDPPEAPIVVPLRVAPLAPLGTALRAALPEEDPPGSGNPPPRRAPRVHRDGPMTLDGRILEPQDVIPEGKRVALFVDDGSMSWASQQAGFSLEWRKALSFFLGHGSLAKASYHIVEAVEAPYRDAQRQYVWALARMGYTVHAAPTRIIRKEESEVRKANLETRIVAEMLQDAYEDRFDVAVLFSGDADLEPAVRIIRGMNKPVYVVSTKGCLAWGLANAADRPLFFIEHFRGQLERTA